MKLISFFKGFFRKLGFGKDKILLEESSDSGSGTSFSKERIDEINRRLLEGGKEELEKMKLKYKRIDEEKEKSFSFRNFDNLISKLNNQDITGVLKVLKNKYPNFLSKGFFGGSFKSKKEVNELLEEEIISVLEDEYLDLKRRMSFLRKKGKKLVYTGWKLMFVSSKLKSFKSNINKKKLERILSLMDWVSKVLKTFELKVEQEEKIK